MSNQIREQLQATLGAAYTLERELGGGGMSRVFVAEEHRLRRKVVVKVLPPDLAQSLSVERFEREIQTAAALQQANIVPVLTAGDTNGLPFYMMPFVEGESLRARLARGPLAITEVIGVLRDVSKALAYAHRHGVVHRDIKPDNVLLSEGTAVVTDFGIAKAISAARTGAGGATLTQIGTSIGTPAYMAPEQAAGDPHVDHRADIYSLGAMAYELLVGQPVFSGRTPQRQLAAHMTEAPKPVSESRLDVPAPLAELVMHCLAKDADQRPQQAADITRVLETITSGSGMQSMPPVLLGGPGMFGKALGIYAAAFVVVAIVAKAAIVGIGLPDWVFPGSLIVMALGLPVILWTAYVQRVVRASVTQTPTYTPGGSPSAATHGTMATMALKAAPHVSWYRTARGGIYGIGAFVFVIGAFMALRSLGIGPVGSLLASGELRESDRVLLTDFSVSSGDTTLGRVVSDAVRAGLSQAKSFTVVTPGEMAATLRRMGLPVTTQMNKKLAQEIAQREGFKAILDGDVAAVAGSYIVSVRLVRADSGRELTSQRATAAGADKLIDAADDVARRLLSKAGESLKRVQGTPRLAQMTTSSIEALRKYSEGARANDMEADNLKAIPLLREAVALDPNFAEAWRKLGVAISNQGLPRSQSDSAITRAYLLRDRLADSERDRIIAYYFTSGPGRDRAKGIAAYDALLARGDSTLVLNNQGQYLTSRREYARAETLLRANIRRNPRSSLALTNLLGTLGALQKQEAYDSMLDRFYKVNPQTAKWFAMGAMFDRGRIDEFERTLDSLRRFPDAREPARAWWNSADMAGERGQLERAHQFALQAMHLDSAAGRRATSLDVAIGELRRRGNAEIATDADIRKFETFLVKNPIEQRPLAERPYLRVASAFAVARRPDRARAVLAQYRATVDTAQLRDDEPDVHAVQSDIAWGDRKWMDAIREARLADQRPDGPSHECAHCLPLQLTELFTAAGMADSAIAQYEVFKRTPWGSRKHVGSDWGVAAQTFEALGRAYETKGDTTRAAEFYSQFIERWKSADPELQPRVAAVRDKLRRWSLDAPKR